MEPRRALIVSAVAAALAVAIVAADLEMGIEVELDAMVDGEWETIAWSDGGYGTERSPFGDCPGPDMRVIIENDKLWGHSDRLVVTLQDNKVGGQTILDETVTLGAQSHEIFEFTVPVEPRNGTSEGSYLHQTSINVQYGDIWLYSCVEAA